MAVEKPTWTYKSKGDKQTASEMNELAQAVITNAIELSNTKDDIASLSDDITNFDNRITSIEESETVKKEERNQPNGYAGLDSSGKVPIERIYGATATVTDVAAYELLPATGSNGVIYNVLNTGTQYKWSGSAYIDITDGAGNAKKNETSIFDCSNGTSTKYYSILSDAINVVPPVYRTSNRVISYLSVEYPQVELIVNNPATVDGSISIYLDGVLKSTISVTAGMTAIQIADRLSASTYVDYAPWSWTDSGSTNKFTLTYGDNNISKKVTSYSYTAEINEVSGLISFNILKEGFAPTAVNYQYSGINSTTWTNLAKWERILNKTDLTNVMAYFDQLDTILYEHTHDFYNPHTVTKSQIGLSNVDNTSDVDKPVSILQQIGLDNKVDKTAFYELDAEVNSYRQAVVTIEIDSNHNLVVSQPDALTDVYIIDEFGNLTLTY